MSLVVLLPAKERSGTLRERREGGGGGKEERGLILSKERSGTLREGGRKEEERKGREGRRGD